MTTIKDLFFIYPPRKASRTKTAQPYWAAVFPTSPGLEYGVAEGRGETKDEAIENSLGSLRAGVKRAGEVFAMSWGDYTLLVVGTMDGYGHIIIPPEGVKPYTEPEPGEPVQMRSMYPNVTSTDYHEALNRGKYHLAQISWLGWSRPPWESGSIEVPSALVDFPNDLDYYFRWQIRYIFWEGVLGGDPDQSMKVHHLACETDGKWWNDIWSHPHFQRGYTEVFTYGPEYNNEQIDGWEIESLVSTGAKNHADLDIYYQLGWRYAQVVAHRVQRSIER